MWNSVFVVFLVIGGSLGMVNLGMFQDCDISMCKSPPSSVRPGTAPDEEQLKEICSPLLERFNCQKNAYKACTGKSLEELALSDNTTVASFSTLALNLERVSEEICDENSLLHESYVANIGCFNEMMKVQRPKCRQEAVTIYRAFVESQKLLGVVKTPTEEAEDADCLITAYAVACFTIEVKEQCGEVARATMVEILRRIQFVTYGLDSCNKDQVDVLRTTYLEFMEFEDEKKSWFSQVFNSRK